MSATLEQLSFRAVGTSCSAAVTVRAPLDAGRASAALAAAVAEVEACEAALSRFRETSDLSRLNGAQGHWTAVGERLLEALRLALRARDETGGRFDPTILPALVAAGYDRSFAQLEGRPPATPLGWRAGGTIELDETRYRARLQPATAVDLGGIGKGYAASRALKAMKGAWPGIPGGIVDLGGDIALWGETPEQTPWRIAVADPRTPGATAGTLLLQGGGVATSGRDVRRFGPQHSLHHLIDPATGRPAEPGPLTVTVVASSATEAEAHATALAISPRRTAIRHVAAHPALAALYIPAQGAPLVLGALPLAPSRQFVVVG